MRVTAVSAVIPGHAKREPGIHSHGIVFGEDWQRRVFAKPLPVVMGPGLALARPGTTGAIETRPRGNDYRWKTPSRSLPMRLRFPRPILTVAWAANSIE
ncbi:hypothetical protein FBZ94_111147 [Bradyrhizobium sacchari]|uniref:Uncharacterized protein n=1 Tax=Bradyrhizobium sacchari TaxID=1399419 RepID=A0A560JDC9_9BRAD|nr:hypothetical protein FBZ94_111147 [Bradyrhizobium sacchari]TWB68977.1 hypothetical protein FBZ95_11097 [Bradyrhizobium sacchari]